MTTSIELFALAKKLNIKVDHILFKDQLSQIKFRPDLSIIINMSNSNHEGTHWVALYCSNDVSIYCDSFGVIPPIEVINFVLTKLVFSDFQTESLTGINCGQLALYFLKQCQDIF